MKKLLFVAAIFFFLNITGCYTVIWSPGMDFPTADRNAEYNSIDSTGYYNDSDNFGDTYVDVYYSEPYYGHYAGYYNTPWWYSIAPPTVSHNNKNKKNDGKATANSNGEVTPVRNSGDGRGSSDRNTGDIINTPPVTVSGSGSGSTGSGTPASGSDAKKTDSGSDNSRQSTGSGSVRNNDGSRNDGGRK